MRYRVLGVSRPSSVDRRYQCKSKSKSNNSHSKSKSKSKSKNNSRKQ